VTCEDDFERKLPSILKCSTFAASFLRKSSRKSRPRRQGWLVLFLLACTGCTPQPAAPLLSDAPVYRSAAEGFRFLVPEGWTQTASSVLPPGKLTSEVFLARYKVRSAELGATLYIICMSDNKSLDLEQHHTEPSFRIAHWDVAQPRRTLSINKVTADRMIYKAVDGKREMTKHVTCFRRNDRVYSFVGLYWSDDEQAPQQIERAVESVIWDR
jgi:hypothetical protein